MEEREDSEGLRRTRKHAEGVSAPSGGGTCRGAREIMGDHGRAWEIMGAHLSEEGLEEALAKPRGEAAADEPHHRAAEAGEEPGHLQSGAIRSNQEQSEALRSTQKQSGSR